MSVLNSISLATQAAIFRLDDLSAMARVRIQLAAAFIRLILADQTLNGFFASLSNDITTFIVVMAAFFFALSALFYMSSGATNNERMRTHAVGSLYAALAGLALALLAHTIAVLINNAATGASSGGGQ